MTTTSTHHHDPTAPPANAGTRTIVATVGRDIDAAPGRVWAVLADEFASVGEWASTVATSTAWSDQPAADSPPVGRSCAVPGFGQTQERITVLDPDERTIAYAVEADGAPPFLRAVESTWQVTPLDGGRTAVQLTIEAKVAGFVGRLAAPMLRLQFRRTQRRVLSDLDIYARTGQVSERKARMTTAR